MHASVVAAVDGVPRGFEVVRVAEQLAAALDLPLSLVSVVDQPRGFAFGDPEADRDRQARRARAAYWLREIAATMDLPRETHVCVESGNAAAMLTALADDAAARIVVAGSRGRGRIRAALFGSVTGELVKHLSCPLVVVPAGAAGGLAAAAACSNVSVVCGIDGAAPSRLLGFADHLAARLGAQLHVVHIRAAVPAGVPFGVAGAPRSARDALTRDQQDALDALDRAADLIHEAGRVEFSLQVGDTAIALSHIAEGTPTGLIVVSQDSPWQRLAASAGVPVAVVPSSRLEVRRVDADR